MTKAHVPLYLIVLLVAIPQLSETIYAPALTNLSKSFDISANAAEFTFFTYLVGFGFGVLLWGTLSDRIGRKPGFILGLIIYILACYGCFITQDIQLFYILRFLQAFGASVGSVLGLAVARDAIQPDQRSKLFSVISMAMAFSPAIGPVIGSLTVHYSFWKNVFLVLMGIAALTLAIVLICLPETLDRSKTVSTGFIKRYVECFKQMIFDKKVLGLGFLVGSVNGILFGYFAESPFFFIEFIKISQESFGMLAFLVCLPLFLGGFLSHHMHKSLISKNHIIQLGIWLIILSSFLFLMLTLFNIIAENSRYTSLVLSCSFIFIVITGISMIIPNALSHALEDYGQYTGIASSFFGFYYYCIVASFTYLMSYLHNGTMSQLPFFFLLVGVLMAFINFTTTSKDKKRASLS